MTRLAAGLESLDDEHAAAAARARTCERLFWIVLAGFLGRILLSRRWGEVQELAHGVNRFGAIAAGEQAIVAYAVEALGQDVDEEAADELVNVERHRGVAARSLDPVVLDLEGDPPPVERDQAAVGDGDTVGVARQIGEHGLGASERALGIDEPALLSERGKKRCESLGVREMRMDAEELQLTCRVSRSQLREHQPPEQFGEYAHRQ